MSFFVVIVIAIVLVIIFKLNKGDNKTEHSYSHINKPSNISVDSDVKDLLYNPYYSKYSRVFDYIVYAGGNQSRYKIDWMLYSLEQGKELEDEGLYIIKSIDENLPYYCETELEYDRFFDKECPVLLGDIESIISIMLPYSTINKHTYKHKFWVDLLIDMADLNNLEAQGLLCSDKILNSISSEEKNKYIEKYKQLLIDLANSGVANAQYVVGEYLCDNNSKKQVEYFTKAAQQGVANAWYSLSRYYRHKIYFDENNELRNPDFSDETIIKLQNEELKCMYECAKADNGTKSPYCQYMYSLKIEDNNPQEGEYWKQKSNYNYTAKTEIFKKYIDEFLKRNSYI